VKNRHPVIAFFSLLLFGLAFLSAGTGTDDQSKKTYELMYQDIQALKLQVAELASMVKQNTAELKEVKDQVKILNDLLRKSQAADESLRTEINNLPLQYQKVNSSLEELQFQLSTLQDILQAVQSLSEELKAGQKGSSKSSKQPVTKKTEPAASQPVQTAVVTIPAQEMYNNAYSDYLKGNYDLAIESFKLFLQQYPTTPLADNALYWIGECYYSQGKYTEAIESFNDLLLNYPNGDKVPAAYLKKGMSFIQQGKKDEALATFKLLVSKYPQQEEARLAQQKINELVGK